MIVKEYVEGFREKISDYSQTMKETGKKALIGATVVGLLGATSVSGYAADPDFLGHTDEVEAYAEEHVSEEDEELFRDLYHFVGMGEERKDSYTHKRFEVALENISDKYLEGSEKLDNEEFVDTVVDLVPKLGDIFYGDKDGEVDSEEYKSFFSDKKDNKAFQEINNLVSDYEMMDEDGFYSD